MTRYHESPTSGKMEVCPAKIRCTLKAGTLHVDANTPEEAQAALDKHLEQQYDMYGDNTVKLTQDYGHNPVSETDREFPEHANIFNTRAPATYPEGFERKPAWERLAAKSDYLALEVENKFTTRVFENQEEPVDTMRGILQEAGLEKEFNAQRMVDEVVTTNHTLGSSVYFTTIKDMGIGGLSDRIGKCSRNYPGRFKQPEMLDYNHYKMDRRRAYMTQAKIEDEENYNQDPGKHVGEYYMKKNLGGVINAGSRYPRTRKPYEALQQFNKDLPEKYAHHRFTEEDIAEHQRQNVNWETVRGMIAAHANSVFQEEGSAPPYPGGQFTKKGYETESIGNNYQTYMENLRNSNQ